MHIGHVHLKVRNLNRSEYFYSRLLGATRTERLGNHYSFLSMGAAHHEIALQEIGSDAKQPSMEMLGLYHTAFEVGDPAELLASISKLGELTTEYALVDHGISWAVYTSDPDGNGVEIYLDRREVVGGTERWNGSSRKLSEQEIKMSS